jgi:hypothetical protein
MNNMHKTALSVLATAIALACSSASAQENPVDLTPPPSENVPTPGPSLEPTQPISPREPARPEQVEEAVDEALSPSDEPSTSETSPNDTPEDPNAEDTTDETDSTLATEPSMSDPENDGLEEEEEPAE